MTREQGIDAAREVQRNAQGVVEYSHVQTSSYKTNSEGSPTKTVTNTITGRVRNARVNVTMTAPETGANMDFWLSRSNSRLFTYYTVYTDENVATTFDVDSSSPQWTGGFVFYNLPNTTYYTSRSYIQNTSTVTGMSSSTDSRTISTTFTENGYRMPVTDFIYNDYSVSIDWYIEWGTGGGGTLRSHAYSALISGPATTTITYSFTFSQNSLLISPKITRTFHLNTSYTPLGFSSITSAQVQDDNRQRISETTVTNQSGTFNLNVSTETVTHVS